MTPDERHMTPDERHMTPDEHHKKPDDQGTIAVGSKKRMAAASPPRLLRGMGAPAGVI